MFKKTPQPAKPAQANILEVLKPYLSLVILLVVLAVIANSLGLILPKIISKGIDAYIRGGSNLTTIIWEFGLISLFVFGFTYWQSILQTLVSERVAKDLRQKLSAKISQQSFAYIQTVTTSKLLTNLTSDIDSVKMFVSQAIVSIVSSIILIAGASILLLTINWRLALVVLTIVPIIGGTFFFVFSKVRTLFLETREVIDWLNKVINESILGAALIRVLNAQKTEATKFIAANSRAKELGMKILSLFASMIPIITFVANLGTLAILVLGGHYIITGSLTLGDYAAFNSYVGILIFPIIMLGFMSNIIAQATASYQRVAAVLNKVDKEEKGELTSDITGDIEVRDITMTYGEKVALKDVSFTIKPHTRTAIIGPTAAGKTQLLYLLTGLIEPDKGTVKYDGHSIAEYDKEALHHQVGLVFQDSIVFNMTLRENIAFNGNVTPGDLQQAIDTAQLHDFIDSLPEGLETVISERGTTLSGGQKQRVMLARALALNPKILLLDDFTARVDTVTEQKILGNVAKDYPNITLISITQKITSVEHYDQIILLMEGEVLAVGTHSELMHSSPEYVQIYNSQASTSNYEVQS